MEQTTPTQEKSIGQATVPQENYMFGQKITPVAIYCMFIALGLINIAEFCFIVIISSKVSALCDRFHIVFYH